MTYGSDRLWWESPTHCLLAAEVFLLKYEDRRNREACNRDGWPLVIVLEELAKSWFQTEQWPPVRNTAVPSLTYVTKGCNRHPGCLVSIGRCMKWAVNPQSHRTTWLPDRLTACGLGRYIRGTRQCPLIQTSTSEASSLRRNQGPR